MASSKSTYIGEEKLFYFTGKVRAFWKDKIFFLDQKNAAVIGFDNLYINGHKATQGDLHSLDVIVASCDGDMAPVLHSYVSKYKSSEVPSWSYKMEGKVLWLAHFAWIGTIPSVVEQKLQACNVVPMPITYYTGHVLDIFPDFVLFGNSQNNVMAHVSDLSIHGQKASSVKSLLDLDRPPVLRAYIISLEFLASKKYEGPVPSLLSLPVNNYGLTIWIAKFAWVGEMPSEVREVLCRFHIIKMNEWNSLYSFGRNLKHSSSIPGNNSQSTLFSVSQGAKGNGFRIGSGPLLVSTQKEAAIVKGLLLVANHEYGLINSHLDVIVFHAKNFYVNGEMFKTGKALDKFFHDKALPLTAWIVPLPEPVLVFDIYVMWRAVCVWHGIPPKNMEAIKNRYDNGIISGSVPDALNTTSDNRYTLVQGRVTEATYGYGFALAEVGNTTISISFKRKSLYVKGCRLPSKANLLTVQKEFDTSIWTMLVYPVNEGGNATYTALALWQEKYQHFVSADLLYRILPRLEGAESADNAEEDKMGIHMTGFVIKTTAKFGIVQTTSFTTEPSYIFFLRSDFYVDGTVPEIPQMLKEIDQNRQVNLFARSTKYQVIKDYPVTMYATLVWMGKKPSETQTSSSSILGELPSGDNSVARVLENNPSSTSSTPDCKSPDNLPNVEVNNQSSSLTNHDTPVLVHKYGRIIFLHNRYGIIQCGHKEMGYVYVLFDFSAVWVDGECLKLCETLDVSIIQEEVQWNLLAYDIPVARFSSYQVSMKASAAWIGRRPSHICLPETKCPLKAMEEFHEREKTRSNVKRKKSKDYVINHDNQDPGNKAVKDQGKELGKDQESECKDISSKLSDMQLSDEKGFVPVSLEEVADSLEKPHAGKHINGRILKLMKGCGIAMWRCAAKEGEVYMFFLKKNVYVNLCPIDESYKLDKTKSFNFYVVPVIHRTMEGHKISMYASCGWRGSKPHDIPAPGEQHHSKISLEGVFALDVNIGKTVIGHIVKIIGNKGIARWRSQSHGGDIFIEFKKAVTCDNIKSMFDKGIEAKEVNGVDEEEEQLSRTCFFHVKPIENKKLAGYVVSLTAEYGWQGKKPSNFPKLNSKFQPSFLGLKFHACPIPPDILQTAAALAEGKEDPGQSKSQEKLVSALDSLDADLNKQLEIKEKNVVMGAWEEDDISEITLEGNIVELYSNNGRLQGCDGKQYFFSRENSYLYGVCLNNVELWHVLVQDEAVSYRLSEIVAGESKVKKMWIGPEELPGDESTKRMKEWCDKHSVPDGAKELLIHQIEVNEGMFKMENGGNSE